MKLTKFTQKMNNLFKGIATVRMDISMHGESTILEVSAEDSPEFFGQNQFSSKKFVALIDLDKRFEMRESNFSNVPEQIRNAVFETVIEFVSTPINKR